MKSKKHTLSKLIYIGALIGIALSGPVLALNLQPDPPGRVRTTDMAKGLQEKVDPTKERSLNKPENAIAESKEASSSRSQLGLDLLKAASKTLPIVRFRNGFPRSVKLDLKIEGSTPETQARNFLREYKDFYLQTDPDHELILKRQSSGEIAYVVYSQQYQGIPIFGAELLLGIHNQAVRLTVGELLVPTDLARQRFSVIPSISKDQAESATRDALQVSFDTATIADTKLAILDLSLFHDVPSNPRLVWRVSMAGNDKSWELFVDAHNEEILFSLGLEHEGGESLHDFDFDLQHAEDMASVGCYSENNVVNVADEDWFNGDYLGDPDATFANTHARNTYAFFHDHFGLHSFDNEGSQMEVLIHTTVDNAQWSPACREIRFRTGWVDYEVMVHEFTHGVISYSSNLVYAFESGALNESYADIMAVVADRERGDMNWTLAEDRTGVSGGERDLQNPKRDKYSEYNPGMPNSAGVFPDNGGVHLNSGIPNKTAYLMAEGDLHNGVVAPSIGLSKMRELKYAALRGLGSTAQFEDARDVEVWIAEIWAINGTHFFTNQDACSVQNAWAAVEVGEACDTDYDNDGCSDENDHDPWSNKQDIGRYICLDCADGGIITGWSGEDSDGDGILNCEDDDDDEDGIPDQSDSCPVGKLSGIKSLPHEENECFVRKICNSCPLQEVDLSYFIRCKLGDCVKQPFGIDNLINPGSDYQKIINPNELINNELQIQ